MKKLALLVFACLSVASQAIVFPTGFFATPAIMQEGFDTTAAGSYNNLPVFGVPALMSRIGVGGQLQLGPFLGTPSVPHMIAGVNVDARITSVIPMRRFGGFFRSGVFGAISQVATFRFFDVNNNPIGSATVPMNTTWTWVGFQTFPKWRRVEIFGAIPGAPGYIGMDSLRIRPW